MVGLLDYGLARVADLMIKYVITPVINSASPIAFVEELNQDTGKMVEAILKLDQSSNQVVLLVSLEISSFPKTLFDDY